MFDMDKVVFREVLQTTDYYNRKPTERRISHRDKNVKTDTEVRRNLNLDTELNVKGNEKFIILSDIIDIWTRLQVLLGFKLSGHTDTLTEGSNLIDELYKRGEIQNNEQH